MLVVSTGQLSDPVVFFVLMVAGNGLFHELQSRTEIPEPQRIQLRGFRISGDTLRFGAKALLIIDERQQLSRVEGYY
jgi:hypothetical protein